MLDQTVQWSEMCEAVGYDGPTTPTSEEDRQEGVTILAQEAERLQGIVHRMLDTAKREARGIEYELKPGDLNEVVGAAAERFRRITAEPGLEPYRHFLLDILRRAPHTLGEEAESVLATGHGLEVAAGTQIRVLERANRGRELRVRILSGPWQGRIVWVPARWVQ